MKMKTRTGMILYCLAVILLVTLTVIFGPTQPTRRTREWRRASGTERGQVNEQTGDTQITQEKRWNEQTGGDWTPLTKKQWNEQTGDTQITQEKRWKEQTGEDWVPLTKKRAKGNARKNGRKDSWEPQKTTAEEREVNQETVLRARGPLQPNDTQLLQLIRSRYLFPPSNEPPDLMVTRSGPDADSYNLYRTNFPSWVRINNILKRFFPGAPPGMFVEAGALDGEFLSNTFYLERELGWTGILVEADPVLHSALTEKHRQAWSSPACLSLAPYPQILTFHSHYAGLNAPFLQRLLVRSTGSLGGIKSPTGGQMGRQMTQTIQCFPLVSILLALNFTSVHYISLDVEGAESDVLINFPFDQVDVQVWTIEHREGPAFRQLYEAKLAIPDSIHNVQGVNDPPNENTNNSRLKEKDNVKVLPDTQTSNQEQLLRHGNWKIKENQQLKEKITTGDNLSVVQRSKKDTITQNQRGRGKKDHFKRAENTKPMSKEPVKRVVYVTQHDPAAGRDKYLVWFMFEKGYVLYDYWDGDYTFIKKDTNLCHIHCSKS